MLKTRHLVLALSMAIVFLTAGANAAPKFKAWANLTGDTAMKGKAKIDEKHGSLQLDVHVLRAGGFQTFEVAVNGEIIGQIFTNPGGSGRLRVSRPLQSIRNGDVISVGPISGSLGGHGGSAGHAQSDKLELRGDAIASSGAQYEVRYCRQSRNGTADQRLVVMIDSAEPFQSVPVFVNGWFLAPILPGEDGRGELRMRTAAFIEGGESDPWQALPGDFPALSDGAQVQVGATYITLRQP